MAGAAAGGVAGTVAQGVDAKGAVAGVEGNYLDMRNRSLNCNLNQQETPENPETPLHSEPTRHGSRHAGNPRGHWCYMDESEIGAATRLAEVSQPKTLHRCIIEKHRLS